VNRGRSPWLVVGVLAAAVVAVNLVLREVDQATRDPGGPESSSYATAPGGVAAYTELLRRYGHPVVRVREPLADAQLDARATLVMLEPREVSDADAEAVRGFLERGGRLLAGGEAPRWLAPIVPDSPPWQPRATTRAVATAVPGVGIVRTAAVGTWRTDDGVLVESGVAAVAVERRVGAGTAVLLADPSPLQNRLLGEADNAALGLAFAGSSGRPVAFAESVHGYGPSSGIAAIPTRWWWVFGGLALAAIVLALARGRRLGPPERRGRELPPARAEYAEAVATQLARTPGRGIETARRVVRETALARGLSPAEADALATDDDLLALGRALRDLERKEAIA
jgi:Domain of unknown function (DUF4350)